MKRYFYLLAIVFMILFVSACNSGSSDTDTRTINHFLQAFEDGGFDTSDRQTPLFQMIGANDGIQFIIDDRFHSVYSFENVTALEQAFTDNPFMETQGWITNGRFVIESGVDEINEFFRNIE